MPAFSEEMSEKTPTAAAMLSQAQAQAQVQRNSTYPNFAPIRRHPTPQDGVAGSSQSSPSMVPSAPAPPTAGQSQPISVRHLPHFPTIEEALGSSSSAHNHAAREVWGWFQDHLDLLLDSIRLFRFDQFEMHVRNFWPSLQGVHRELVHAPAVAGLMARADAIVYDVGCLSKSGNTGADRFVYQEILEILRSQMLSPIPAASLASLRQLADKMEKILLVALDSYGNTFVEPKVELGARFGHLVRELTPLRALKAC
jgi:regulatory factor X, other